MLVSLLKFLFTTPIGLVILMLAITGARQIYVEVKHSYHLKMRRMQKRAQDEARFEKELDAYQNATSEPGFATMSGVKFYDQVADFIESDPEFPEIFPMSGYDAYPHIDAPEARIDDFFDRVSEYAEDIENKIFGTDIPAPVACEDTIVDQLPPNFDEEELLPITTDVINAFAVNIAADNFYEHLQELLNEDRVIPDENHRDAG